MRCFHAAIAATFVTAACSAALDGADQPHPTGVVPDRAPSAEPVQVVIQGTGFLASAKQASSGGAPTLDTTQRAWLGEVELGAVTWIDPQTVQAVVPAGLAPGQYDLTVQNALGERGSLQAAYTVLTPGSLAGVLSTGNLTVSVGQQLAFTLTLTNSGETDVTKIAFSTPAVATTDGGGARLTGAGPTPPDAMAPGEQRKFTWSYEATSAGHVSFSVGATGIDGASGDVVDATIAALAPVLIQQPAALVAVMGVPPSVVAGTDFTVTMTVTNTGGALARGVTAGTPSLSGTPSAATATLKAGPEPASADIASGASAVFAWAYTAGSKGGTLSLVGTALGNDANAGTAVIATTPVATTVIAQLPATTR